MENGIYDRVKNLCDTRGITVAKLESDCGFANTTIRKWRTINNPSVDKIKTIAQYFGVTADYIIGMTDIPTPPDDEDIVSLQRAKSRMPSNDWQLSMRMLRAGFQDAFKEDN